MLRRLPALLTGSASRVTSRGLMARGMLGARLYSKKNIDDFNKSKTEYNFNSFSSKDIHERVAEQIEEQQQIDINEVLESDPRLQNLEPGSPDYKEMLHELNEEFLRNQKKNHKKYESRERLKAVGLGIVAVVGMISVHQFLFHYQWYKAYFNKSSYNLDDSHITGPQKSTNHLDYLKSKLLSMIDGDFLSGVLHSDENTGLYISGEFNGKRLPTRLSFFDHKYIKDAKILKDLLVVVTGDGKAYQYSKNSKESPKLISLPAKVESCEITKDYIYFLTNKSKLVFIPRDDKQLDFTPSKSRNWFGLKRDNNYGTLDFHEKVQKFASGDIHLLILTEKGKLFTVKTAEGDNNAQFGAPGLAPVENPDVPLNKPFELTLMNNEIITSGDSKTVKPRNFVDIATGNFHNLALDSHGGVWSWGKNSYGQCGLEVNYKSDLQPVPTKVFDPATLSKLLRQPVSQIENVYANHETSFLKIRDDQSKELFISFGNGLRGQLGTNRFLHLTFTPVSIKSLSELTEFNETSGKVENIEVKHLSTGANHLILKLTNNDVLIFGDNESGQFGNGKVIKSSKPIPVPKLIEPKDVSNFNDDKLKGLAKKINSPDNRLSLKDELRIKGKSVEQVIAATDNSSIIYYKRK